MEFDSTGRMIIEWQDHGSWWIKNWVVLEVFNLIDDCKLVEWFVTRLMCNRNTNVSSRRMVVNVWTDVATVSKFWLNQLEQSMMQRYCRKVNHLMVNHIMVDLIAMMIPLVYTIQFLFCSVCSWSNTCFDQPILLQNPLINCLFNYHAPGWIKFHYTSSFISLLTSQLKRFLHQISCALRRYKKMVLRVWIYCSKFIPNCLTIDSSDNIQKEFCQTSQ